MTMSSGAAPNCLIKSHTPYIKLGLIYTRASTIDGSNGEGYSYEKVLGSGVDYVRYIYGIKYRYPWLLEPEIGLSYISNDSFSASYGISYQRVKLAYYKGIEAYGRPQNLQFL